MKPALIKAITLSLLIVFSTIANESTTAQSGAIPFGPPDKEKVSYALGMNLGLQRRQSDADVDIEAFAQGLKDIFEGKSTEVKESEIVPLLNRAVVNRIAGQADPEKERVSYALGMRMGGQLKRVSADVDADVIVRGLKDVLEGKTTKIQQSEIEPLFEQAKAYGAAKESEKNKIAGEAFLTKNAKAEGISILPDGLQYRIIHKGDGEKSTTNDLLIVKYHGKFVNGKEFDRGEHFLTRSVGGIKGWQDALQRMKVGEKWEIFVPSELGFGHEGEPAIQVGPDATLIYDLELVSIAKDGDPLIGTGSLGHGLDGEYSARNSTQ